MSTTIITCANCGKSEESSGGLKSCTACKLVKYCNRDCQIAHRPQHKKACKKRVAELYDKKFFKEPSPPREECPICMLPLPLYANHTGVTFKPCCGKSICLGCVDTMMRSGGINTNLCAFCRTPRSRSDEEEVNRVKKLVDAGNALAIFQLAGYYDRGIRGFLQDSAKANELLLKAGQLGCADAYYNLGNQHFNGMGVEVDKKKARHYYKLAALNGDVQARHYLGCLEGQSGNHQRALKHFIIAARAGNKLSLDTVKEGYMRGHVTKDEHANALREYQKSQDEMTSEARDKALAARNQRMGD